MQKDLAKNTSGPQEISIIDNKQVNFSIAAFATNINTANNRDTTDGKKSTAVTSPRFAQSPPDGSNVPKNYKLITKKRF